MEKAPASQPVHETTLRNEDQPALLCKALKDAEESLEKMEETVLSYNKIPFMKLKYASQISQE